jgi:transposase
MGRKHDYTPEFREEAVKLVTEQGLSQGEAARRLSVPKGTLANWVAALRNKTAGKTVAGRTLPELEQEIRQLRKDLAEARLERDILKKATAYFARESLPGTRS